MPSCGPCGSLVLVPSSSLGFLAWAWLWGDDGRGDAYHLNFSQHTLPLTFFPQASKGPWKTEGGCVFRSASASQQALEQQQGRAGMGREGRAGDRDGDGLPDLSGESWQEWARIRVMEMRGL